MNVKITIFVLLFCSFIESVKSQVISSVQQELSTTWLGFGYNQWGWALQSDGNTYKAWDDELWNTTEQRILAIQPSLVRLPVERYWFNKDDNGNSLPVGTYNWNSKYMQSFYKIMDLYKAKNIKVMSGLWHAVMEGYIEEETFYMSSGNGSFARLQADLIDYLINTKGYTNIKYYTPTNEPLGCMSGYNVWSTMIVNLKNELVARGLPSNILIGADSWGDWIWYPARDNKTQLVGYDFHNYLNDTPEDTHNQLYNRTLESFLGNSVSQIYQQDSINKPVIVSEIAPSGVQFVDWPVANAPAHCRVDTYEYGLGYWDYGIQLLRSGVASGLAWALDSFDQNKSPGMWNNAGTYGGMTLRPWYYTWQLMCRYFPADAKLLKMSEMDNNDLRIAGATIGTSDYTFAIVNRNTGASSGTQTVTLKAEGGAKTFYVYYYNNNNMGDGTSLSLPYVIQKTSNLTNVGVTVTVPAETGVLLTTLAPLSGTSAISNIAFNKNVTVSSADYIGNGGNYAVDGISITRWSSTYSDPQWIYVDLGATYDISRVKLSWQIEAIGKDFVIQTSSDLSSWTTIKTVVGNSSSVNDFTGLSGKGRYVRMYGTARTTQWGYSIYEFEVYGTEGNFAPSVSITSPATNTNYCNSENITINSNATDLDGAISSVAFYNGTTLLGVVNSAPYNYTWSNVGAGNYSITAIATDNSGAVSTSNAVTVNVLSNIALNKTTTVSSADYIGNGGNYAVDGISVTRWSSKYSDPQWIYVDLGATYDISRVKLSWQVEAIGKDFVIQTSSDLSNWTTIQTVVGNSSSVNDFAGLSGKGRYVRMYGTARTTQWGYSIYEFEVYGTEGNYAPSVSITSPVTNTNYYNSANITINSNATDLDGAISSVAFYNGTTLLGVVNSAPYNYIWSNVGAGNYSITAIATDNSGAISTSNVVTVSVLNNIALTKTTKVSSADYVANGGKYAVDGNSVTRWSSKYSDPQWIYVDLGATYDISNIKLSWRAEAIGKNFVIQTSSALPTWTTIKTVVGNSSSVNDFTGLSGKGRYVRIYGTARTTQWGYSIYEFEVYGTQTLLRSAVISNNENTVLETEENTVLESEIKVYPNPVSHNLSILLDKANVAQIEICSIDGRLLYAMQTKERYNSIDLKKIDIKGFIIVKVSTLEKSIFRKVLVQ